MCVSVCFSEAAKEKEKKKEKKIQQVVRTKKLGRSTQGEVRSEGKKQKEEKEGKGEKSGRNKKWKKRDLKSRYGASVVESGVAVPPELLLLDRQTDRQAVRQADEAEEE